ncbi:MAG: endonuclease/exonuclease/phosphatase family protein [Planctomycetota bacterium]
MPLVELLQVEVHASPTFGAAWPVAAATVLTLGVLAVARRPLHPALTVLWQLRTPLAIAGCFVAGACAGLGAGPAALGCASAALALFARLGFERARGRTRISMDRPHLALHVLTHNCGLHRSDPARVATFLADCGAEVIGVQEVQRAHEVAFAVQLGESHPHQVMHPTGVDGIGLLSRYPILSSELVRLDGAHPYLRADVDAPGGPVHFIVFHPSAALALVGRAHAAVRDAVRLAADANRHAPAVLMGDLNSTDATEAWDAFAEAGLVDAFRSVGRGAGVTFPVPFKYLWLPVPPLVRIDFIFTTDGLLPTQAEVGPPTTSDHLPLFATLARVSVASGARDATRAG